MALFDGQEMQREFEEVFGIKIADVSERQAWWLTKFAKYCRLRCRNNAAFNNYMNRNFTGLRFHQEMKTKLTGDEYEGLVITKRE